MRCEVIAGGPERTGAILARTQGDLRLCELNLQRAEGTHVVPERREQGNQVLGFSSRPFVLCGPPTRRPWSGQILLERRNRPFTLPVTGQPEFGFPFGQDWLGPILLATLAESEQSRRIRFRSAAEMPDTFGVAKAEKVHRRLVSAFERVVGATIFFGTEPMKSAASALHRSRFNLKS